jgi:hypothetical protein
VSSLRLPFTAPTVPTHARNSMAALRRLLATVPAGSKAVVYFNDTPQNDFTTLAETVATELPSLTKDGSVTVYPMLVPVSFYNQIIPSVQKADVGLAWSCLNYLRQLPTRPPSMTNYEEWFVTRAKINAAAAQEDMKTILTHRAAEIRAGGSFVACFPSRNSDSSSQLIKQLSAIVLGDIIKEGLMTPQQTMEINSATYDWTLDELKTVLKEVESLWSVQACYEKLIPLPAYHALEQKKAENNGVADEAAIREYSKEIAGWTMAVSAGYIIQALRTGSGREGELYVEESEHETRVVDAIRQKTEDAWFANHKDSPFQLSFVFLKLSRTEA